MSEMASGYSRSHGLTLLDAAVREFGPVFTLEQVKPIARAQKLSDTHLRFLMSSLNAAGWIESIKRGAYAVKSPLFAAEIPPFAVAAALVQPMAISHWSACAQHGFTTQLPAMVQASTPKKFRTPEMRSGKAYSPRGRAVWRACGTDFEFIYVQPAQFWGFEPLWINAWQQVNLTDRERTALDLIARPDIFGGFAAALEMLETALPQIKIDRLVEYALKLDIGSVIKRLGWALEQLGVPAASLSRLQAYPVLRYYLLEPSRSSAGKKDARWKIIDNLKR